MAFSIVNKCDLVLNFLYENRREFNYFSVRYILSKYNVPRKKFNEPFQIADKLKKAKLINGIANEIDCFVQLNEVGIKFCRKHSFSFPKDSVMKSIQAIRKKNNNQTKPSINKHVNQEMWLMVRKEIAELKRKISTEINLSRMVKNDLLECLLEVENNIDVGKSPFFSFQFLLKLSRENREIEQKIIELQKLIFESSEKNYGPEIKIGAVNCIEEIYAK